MVPLGITAQRPSLPSPAVSIDGGSGDGVDLLGPATRGHFLQDRNKEIGSIHSLEMVAIPK